MLTLPRLSNVISVGLSNMYIRNHEKIFVDLLITTKKMQIFLIISEKALPVSGCSSAHHQEHITVRSASGIDTSLQQYWLTIPEAECTVMCS